MDEIDKLHIKLVKEELIGLLESGAVSDPQAQYKIVNTSLRELNLLRDKKISGIIQKYFDDQDNLKKSIEVKQKELQKLIDEYGDNVKEIYEMVKKL
jgi:hypothetical protein